MLALILATAIFGIDNKEFIDTSSKQLKEGYSWTYVGKQKPEGVPALTMKSNGEEFILWKLK
tara:strand:+ start:1434 stop:1619 length:186 start_codon:yes stop_codon:yes gene_type:complete